MHSFSTLSVLFAAALGAFTNAAPIDLSGLSTIVPINLGDVTSSAGLSGVTGELSGVTNELNTVTGGLNLRGVDTSVVTDAVKAIESKVETLGARATTPSVAVVFSTVMTEITPYTEQLTYIVPQNATVAIITPIVASIKGSLTAAIPKLQALVGQELSVILAPVEGEVTLTVAALAKIVATALCLIFTAIGAVLKIVVADVSVEVLPILADLGCTVTALLQVVVPLVGGLVAALLPLLAPVVGIISTLGLTDLSSLLGLSL
ncbi:hypothetical protein HYDPIDRAFT_168121 [Hydnomerulius pinastri MD-312]|uniref:Uncharacterized protein n=1 Tax=Hydnomerulius pinastri MD-312 TaxID=994086 RepID=A0A0C9WEL5_9AGAM|nr:hypothetical protein HYDPIDRAFT_168121 [Hydnomerulius pinastri MD-312]